MSKRSDQANIALQRAEISLSQNKLDEAIAQLKHALKQHPKDPDILEGLGIIFGKTGDYLSSQRFLSKALKVDSSRLLSRYLLACSLAELNKTDKAVQEYKRIIGTNPRFYEAHNNLGVLYRTMGNYEAALECFRNVAALNPKADKAISNLACAEKDAGNFDSAIKLFEELFEHSQSLPEAYSNYLMSLNYLDHLSQKHIASKHRAWDQHLPANLKASRFAFNRPALRKKIRLGFVSPDLHTHSVSYFLCALFEKLDRRQFEVFCYYNNNLFDEQSAEFKQISDNWHNTLNYSDAKLAEVIYADAIDILIDLAGHTGNNRLAVFFQKPAPVQISWLGYPNTTGLSQIDYRLVDNATDPDKTCDDELNTEKLIRLPGSFICFTAPKKSIPIEEPNSGSNRAFTYGSFNNLDKVSDSTLDLWSVILKGSPESKLLIKSRKLANPRARKKLLSRFEARSIGLDRLILHDYIKNKEAHLSLYNEVDLALDTTPYNGTTTTCEALYMGVPTIALAGDRHAARVGHAIMSHTCLEEYTCDDADSYVNKAISASTAQRTTEDRKRVRDIFLASIMCDAEKFTGDFSSTLTKIWSTYLQNNHAI